MSALAGAAPHLAESPRRRRRNPNESPQEAMRSFMQTRLLPYAVGIGLAIPVPAHIRGFSLGHVLAVFLLPQLVQAARVSRLYRLTALATVLAGVTSYILWVFPRATSYNTFNSKQAFTQGSDVVMILFTITIAYWLSLRLGLQRAVMLVAFGQTIITLAALNGAFVWKGALSFPITLLLLGWAQGSIRRNIGVFFVVAIISMNNDSRSFIIETGLAVALGLILQRMKTLDYQIFPLVKRIVVVAVIGMVGWTAYGMAAESGILGKSIQERQEKQDTKGGVLLNARPERIVARQMFEQRPIGYGLGYIPTATDISEGQYALFLHDHAKDTHYAAVFLLKDRIELHAVAADLWAHTGWGGIALSLALSATAVGGILSRGFKGPWMVTNCFLAITVLAALGFGSIGSTQIIAVCVGLLLASPAFGRGLTPTTR